MNESWPSVRVCASSRNMRLAESVRNEVEATRRALGRKHNDGNNEAAAGRRAFILLKTRPRISVTLVFVRIACFCDELQGARYHPI
ncbi:MAG: hypothetical protein C4334_01390 [Pyrinomonas sp.]